MVRTLAPCLIAVLLVFAACHPPTSAEDEDPGPPAPDFAFYKQRVARIVHEVCAECHADPRERLGRHFLRPRPGRPIRERDHERNFETILRLITPGDPSSSPWLLKPLGPDQGGVQHGGGRQIGFDSLEYGIMIDFINGRRYEPPAFVVPPREEGRPDFRYFVARVAPVLANVCSECHVDKPRGRFRPLILADPGDTLSLEQHHQNYENVLGLLVPGRPERSRFLLKPLAEADGGIAHKGGDRIFVGDTNHLAWTEFIRGVEGPPLERERTAAAPEVTGEGLLLEAEDGTLGGGAQVMRDDDAGGRLVVEPGANGGLLQVTFRVPATAVWHVRVRLRGPGAGPTIRIDRGPARPLPDVDEGLHYVGADTLLDGSEPIDDLRGDVRLVEMGLDMAGRPGRPALWLSPADADHTAVELHVDLPPETEGGDDAWLLFDMDDADNGKFLGLSDGARRIVMGVLEGGVPRVLDAADAPAPRGEAPGRRVLRVEYLDGVAVGRIDGRPLLSLHLGEHLGQGRFGAATHGRLRVAAGVLSERWEVHRTAFRAEPALRLRGGGHVLSLRLPPGGAAVDAVEVREMR